MLIVSNHWHVHTQIYTRFTWSMGYIETPKLHSGEVDLVTLNCGHPNVWPGLKITVLPLENLKLYQLRECLSARPGLTLSQEPNLMSGNDLGPEQIGFFLFQCLYLLHGSCWLWNPGPWNLAGWDQPAWDLGSDQNFANQGPWKAWMRIPQSTCEKFPNPSPGLLNQNL